MKENNMNFGDKKIKKCGFSKSKKRTKTGDTDVNKY